MITIILLSILAGILVAVLMFLISLILQAGLVIFGFINLEPAIILSAIIAGYSFIYGVFSLITFGMGMDG